MAVENVKNIRNRFILQWIFRFALVTLLGGTLLSLLLRKMLMVDLGQSYKRAFYLMKNLETLLPPIIGFSLLFYVVVVCLLAAAVLIYLTYRIAGPLLRMESVARHIRRRDLTCSLPLRHGEQLEELVDVTEKLLDTLRGQLVPLRSQLDDIDSALDELDSAPPELHEETARKTLGILEDRLGAIKNSLPG